MANVHQYFLLYASGVAIQVTDLLIFKIIGNTFSDSYGIQYKQ